MQDNAQQSNDVDMGYIGCLVPDEDDFVSELLLTTLVSPGRSYARKRRAACRRIVSEVYSPPRVTAEIQRAKHPHLVAGFAFDITTVDPDDGMPWDFSIPSKREKARRKCEEQQPYMLIGSPMCTPFCTWMALNEALTKDHATVRAAKEKAIEHINFVVSLYQMQVDAGRYFLHEHPAYATSWHLEAIKALLAAPSVQRVIADQCQFGSQVQRGMHKG